PYTFADDPPQQAPAGLNPAGRRALEIWLWQGYHLLTVLALAAPGAQPTACTLTADGETVFASVRTPGGAVIACTVGSAPAGVWLDQASLTGPQVTLTADFPPPYGPAGPGSVTACGTHDNLVPGRADGAAVRMWSAIAGRLAAHTRGRQAEGATGRLAETVERLAHGLAYLTVTAAPPSPTTISTSEVA
ncbi:hypothetical protein, partial [Acrocarpospora catenulata]|uniref:hypothetical protein n=1 Tax=Acrocarpospora catenulata TaxID=2836182 RepID=UPI001BDB44FE